MLCSQEAKGSTCKQSFPPTDKNEGMDMKIEATIQSVGLRSRNEGIDNKWINNCIGSILAGCGWERDLHGNLQDVLPTAFEQLPSFQGPLACTPAR